MGPRSTFAARHQRSCETISPTPGVHALQAVHRQHRVELWAHQPPPILHEPPQTSLLYLVKNFDRPWIPLQCSHPGFDKPITICPRKQTAEN
eukprot:6432725-Pyramimonas_sp.AAC.1